MRRQLPPAPNQNGSPEASTTTRLPFGGQHRLDREGHGPRLPALVRRMPSSRVARPAKDHLSLRPAPHGLQGARRAALSSGIPMMRQPRITHHAHPSAGRHHRGQRDGRALAQAGIDAVFSYAGRTNARRAAAADARRRFWRRRGAGGLSAAEAITHVIDATHPFAAGMSHNAYAPAPERTAADPVGAPAVAGAGR